MVGKKEGWMKDGTKTDNGICIQTMPTRNFTFSMGLLIDTLLVDQLRIWQNGISVGVG